MSDRMDDVLSSIDEALAGADEDWTVSGDAMRWAPPGELRELPKRPVDRYTMRGATPTSVLIDEHTHPNHCEVCRIWEESEQLMAADRALDARQARNTGPARPDNRRWRNT